MVDKIAECCQATAEARFRGVLPSIFEGHCPVDRSSADVSFTVPSAFKIIDRIIAAGFAGVLAFGAVTKLSNDEKVFELPFAVELVAFIEIAAGLLLLFNLNRTGIRLALAFFFMALATAAVVAELRGSESCGCFCRIGSSWSHSSRCV